MSEKLKPCPFCGGGASAGRFGLWHIVGCGQCGFHCEDFTSDSIAIAAWNRRTPAPPAGLSEACPCECVPLNGHKSGEVCACPCHSKPNPEREKLPMTHTWYDSLPPHKIGGCPLCYDGKSDTPEREAMLVLAVKELKDIAMNPDNAVALARSALKRLSALDRERGRKKA